MEYYQRIMIFGLYSMKLVLGCWVVMKGAFKTLWCRLTKLWQLLWLTKSSKVSSWSICQKKSWVWARSTFTLKIVEGNRKNSSSLWSCWRLMIFWVKSSGQVLKIFMNTLKTSSKERRRKHRWKKCWRKCCTFPIKRFLNLNSTMLNMEFHFW